MALIFAFVAAAMLLASNVNAQCPTCDPNNGAQTVCVVDTTTNALQQFISLCEMDLFNCQNNQNVYQPLYYGSCQTTTATNTAYQPVYTQATNTIPATNTYYNPSTTGTNYYAAGNAVQPNLALSGTDPNGDWSVRQLSNINPTYQANTGMNQMYSYGNNYQYAQRVGAGSVVPSGFVPSTGQNGFQAGTVNNLALQSGVGGGYAAGSKLGGVANNKLGGTILPIVRNQAPANVVGKKPWASSAGSRGAPVAGKLSAGKQG